MAIKHDRHEIFLADLLTLLKKHDAKITTFDNEIVIEFSDSVDLFTDKHTISHNNTIEII